ncbi:MAG TPA: hypothetical protein OIM45_07475 [Clostridiaceae bacterium]|jgi:septum site-determining protein MinC|nr:hypothetical protein [Clostridiaceae bacterium]
MRKSCIEITLKQGKVIIHINEEAEQKKIIETLKKKIPELKELYKDDTSPILITGKVLKNKEIDEIHDLISEYLDVDIDFESPKVLGLYGIKKTFYKDIATSETKFHKGSLRSGQKVEFEGSIVIIGDVNCGAEVISGENIVVLGKLRGLAHAGAKGNKEAIIAGESIESPQIRIADEIYERDKEAIYQKGARALAFINEEGKIVIE